MSELENVARSPSAGSVSSCEDAVQLARDTLLVASGIDEDDLAKGLAIAMGGSADFGDIYLKSTIAESWGLEGGSVKRGHFHADQGFGLRAIAGEDVTFATSQLIRDDTLRQIASEVRDSVGVSTLQERRRQPLTRETIDAAAYSRYGAQDPLGSFSAVEKIALLASVDALARAADHRVCEVNATLSATYEAFWVLRSDGHSIGDVRPLVRLSVEVQVQERGRRERAGSGVGGRDTYTMFTDATVRTLIAKIVTAALVKLDACAAPAGTMSIVIGNGWNGVLLHEAVGHGLEGDFTRRGASAFSGRIGQRVAAPGVTIVDDGTVDRARGSLRIDDEGEETRRTVLIEDGILTGYMQDVFNGRLMGQMSTANGRRENYDVVPMPRMTNTYMSAGKYEANEIIASVTQGLYVASLEGGEVDITSGRFVFEASEAYLIENGRISCPVKGATIVGNGPETLMKVSMIGNDMKLDDGIGVCGKQGQSLPVGVGQPTLRLDGMTVGGTA